MPDELEQRIQRALRDDVADLPMTIVPSMVEERLDRTVASGINLPLAGGAIAAALMLAVVASAWLPGRQPASTPGGSAAPPTAVAPGIANCPLAQPGPAPAEIGEQLFGSGRAWGNDDLWVGGLGDGGVIDARPVFVADDGSIGWKLGWWRGVSGTLEISGRRQDADAPPLEASVPEGYGSTGFQAAGVSFPTEGCWEVTGRVGDAQLTFVTYVIDLQAEMDALFSDTKACKVTLASVELGMTYPATWFAVEPSADQPGCGRFSAEPIKTAPTISGLEGTGIVLGAVGGPEGPRLRSEAELNRQHRRVADLQAMRVEVLDSETGVRSLTYWIAAGPDAEGGPTIVAATYSVGVGSYALNKAVLDRRWSSRRPRHRRQVLLPRRRHRLPRQPAWSRPRCRPLPNSPSEQSCPRAATRSSNERPRATSTMPRRPPASWQPTRRGSLRSSSASHSLSREEAPPPCSGYLVRNRSRSSTTRRRIRWELTDGRGRCVAPSARWLRIPTAFRSSSATGAMIRFCCPTDHIRGRLGRQ